MFKINRLNKKKGFTLIELIVVLAILGILASILVPSMLGIINNASTTSYKTNARSVYSAAQTYVINATSNGVTVNNVTFSASSTGDDKTVYDGVKSYVSAGLTEAIEFTVTSGVVTSASYGSGSKKQTYQP